MMVTYSLQIALPTVPKARKVVSVYGHSLLPERYRLWMEEARRLLALQWPHGPLAGPLRVEIEFQGPSRPRGDLEGLAGAWADAMSGYKDIREPIVMLDDRQIERWSMSIAPGPRWATRIVVEQIPPIDWPADQAKREKREAIEARKIERAAIAQEKAAAKVEP